jgi:hypothetical protein
MDEQQIIIVQATKPCTGCGEVKALAGGFHRDAKSRDGYRNKCKACEKLYKQVNYWSRMVMSSKQADRKHGRDFDDDDEYIDSEWCANMLIEQNGDCCYCHYHLAYGPGVNRTTHPDALTIERIENALAHLKANCGLACMTCNRTRGSTIGHSDMILNGRDLKRGIMKRCSGDCKRIIAVDAFGRNRSRTDGLNNKCKVCERLAKRRSRQRRREMMF